MEGALAELSFSSACLAAKVHEFLRSIGWEPLDAGNITASRELEPLCVLWVNYLFANKYNPNHAFKLLKK